VVRDREKKRGVISEQSQEEGGPLYEGKYNVKTKKDNFLTFGKKGDQRPDAKKEFLKGEEKESFAEEKKRKKRFSLWREIVFS